MNVAAGSPDLPGGREAGAGDGRQRLPGGADPARCRDRAPVTLVSFGFGHHAAPGEISVDDATIVVDVRRHLRDPHVDPALRNLDGRDLPVREAVLRTPGAGQLVAGIIAVIYAFRGGPAPGPVKVAIGCAGGRHRSVVLAADICERLLASDQTISVRVCHRDISKPVLARGAGSSA